MTDWIENWLSRPRFAVYLTAAAADRDRALALYEWNATVSAAFHRDLAHLEVGLRNSYDRALNRHAARDHLHWVFEPHRHFPVELQRAANGRTVDVNAKPRKQIAGAVAAATPRTPRNGRAPTPPAGKVLAELNLGFWRYLTARRHHDTLWIPYLHTAFPAGTDRRDVDRPIGRLHELRNRVAHHEPLLRTDLAGRHQDVLTLAELLAPELAEHLKSSSTVPGVLADRPC